MFKDRGVGFVGVNVPWDNEGNARKFAEDRKVPYAVGHDEGSRITKLYRVDATPITFIVYPDGNVAAVARGKVELDELTEVLKQLTANR
jgi:peroxiredoxin